MNDTAIKRTSFGFGRLRLIIAVVVLVASVLKAYQLAASPLPPVVQSSLFTPLLEMLNNRGLLMFVVEAELLFALILFSGVWLQFTWLASLLCFIVFTFVSVMKGLSGESSCGCFGVITINTWLTASFDAMIVILLAIFREPFKFEFSKSSRKKIVVVLVAWFILDTPILFAMLSLKQQTHATLGAQFTSSNGNQMILLEPTTWIGKEFPLFARFEMPVDYSMLKQGEDCFRYV